MTPQDATDHRLVYLKVMGTDRSVGISLHGDKVIRRTGKAVLVDKRKVASFPQGTPLILGYYAPAPEGAEPIDPAAKRPKAE